MYILEMEGFVYTRRAPITKSSSSRSASFP